MIIISAMSRDRVIGSGEGMPWSVPEEYRQFLGFVKGQSVIMGRRSYEIFGPDLDDSLNFVISRSNIQIDGATVCGSVGEALQQAEVSGRIVYSAGGGSIYTQTIPLADSMYISYIKGEFSGDTYFPEIDEKEWGVAESKDHHDFEFVVYQRR
jgi:dihydrofolate reductase